MLVNRGGIKKFVTQVQLLDFSLLFWVILLLLHQYHSDKLMFFYSFFIWNFISDVVSFWHKTQNPCRQRKTISIRLESLSIFFYIVFVFVIHVNHQSNNSLVTPFVVGFIWILLKLIEAILNVKKEEGSESLENHQV